MGIDVGAAALILVGVVVATEYDYMNEKSDIPLIKYKLDFTRLSFVGVISLDCIVRRVKINSGRGNINSRQCWFELFTCCQIRVMHC